MLGAPSGFAVPEQEHLAVPAGTRLRERPDLASSILAQVEAAAELPLLERHGEWVRVRYGVYKGWVLPGGDEAPLLSSAASPTGADPQRLARAREVLAGGREGALGPYLLVTDLAATPMLDHLGSLAASVDEAYRERLGLDPPPPRGEAVVLFSRDADYRRFSAPETTLEGLDAEGHAGGGMAVLSAEGKEPEVLAALLAHELVHLANRRAFAGELPAWLEEGLAEEMAYSRIDGSGRLFPGTLGGRAEVGRWMDWAGPEQLARARRVSLTGPQAALSRLLESWESPDRPPLAQLVTLSWYELAQPSRRPVLYPLSAFLVRFLLDGGDARLRDGLRTYLAAAAREGEGEAADGGAGLADRLGRSWAEVEADYHAWLRRQAALHLPDPG